MTVVYTEMTAGELRVGDVVLDFSSATLSPRWGYRDHWDGPRTIVEIHGNRIIREMINRHGFPERNELTSDPAMLVRIVPRVPSEYASPVRWLP